MISLSSSSSLSLDNEATNNNNNNDINNIMRRPTTSTSTTIRLEHHHQPRAEQQRTKFLLYLLAFCTVGSLLGKQSFVSSRGSPNSGSGRTSLSSRFLPESIQIKTNNNHNGTSSEQENTDIFGNTISEGRLFVPSLDYRVQGISQYDPDANFPAHVYCTEFAKDIQWTQWSTASKSSKTKQQQAVPKSVPIKKQEDKDQQQHHHHHNLRRHLKEGTATARTSNNRKLQKRLMIGLYSGYDDYATLLEQAVYSARVYGQIWGSNVTVVTLQGTSFAPHGCKGSSSHITLNKIRLLFHAIDHRDMYDQVLILDADSIVYNMDIDITTLLLEESDTDTTSTTTTAALVAGQQVLHGAHKNEVWKVHTGVTLWNLHHPLVASVAIEWFNGAKNGIITGNYVNDEPYLHETLKSHMQWQHDQSRHNDNSSDDDMVLNFHNHEFDYAQGTVVKHFVKDDYSTDIDDPNDDEGHNYLNERLQQMKHTVTEICIDHQEACNSVTQPYYETS